MRLAEILKNFLERRERKKGRVGGDESDELGLGSEMGSQSMLEGDHGKIFGISRRVVTGIGIAIFVLFSVAFIFATNDESQSDEEKSKATANKRMTADKGLPNDYEQLAAYNARKQQEEAAKTPAPVPVKQPAATPASPQQVPQQPAQVALPRTQTQTLPAIPAQVPAVQAPAQQAPQQPAQISEKDRYGSAIAFSFGGGSMTGASGDGSASADGGTATGSGGIGGADIGIVSAGERTLVAGTVFPAMLLTGIDTALEGQVKVQITADVTSNDGSRILIPAGSVAVGTYTGAKNGGRVGLALDTLVFPDGGTAQIGGKIVAVDGAGYTGVKGKAHHHTGARIWNSALTAGIAALATSGTDRAIFDASAIGGIIGVGDSIQNTVTVAPGYRFSLYATGNIDL